MTQTVSKRTWSDTGRPFPYVLMYHSVAVYQHDPYLVTVDPRRFDQQLRWLRSNDLRGVSMRELMQARRAGDARGLVGLTFDDGYADFARNVVPALRRHGCSATVFVIAGRIGGDNEWDPAGPRKRLMTAEEVQEVAGAGVEVGSHGLLHQHLSYVDEDELFAEVVGSRELLREITGQDVAGFCYPYGDVDRRVVHAVEAAGYDYACAIWRSEASGVHALPRTYIGDRDGALRLRAKHLRHRLTTNR
ncbi:polysaccharide deacetylase family protein [Saccharopolyspora sp. WRP15-2]|uniref:Polysaccharide deacetylase family protein n=1 Tax=Saccharopolyspora oryzae TaxID=2997343 RepID=A0ABT4UZ66_9PSEU|nr:polysaccharide deacetylase family protein [Saccharopolyspora oryzae]MDA3626975.1 polysaccharide deacetylase family protein [Saccharopolyspora oryzae]